MALPVFEYPATVGSNMDMTPRVLEARFGDGYRQRSQNGLNNLLAKWNVTFTSLSPETKAAIIAFFEARDAVEAFSWAAPGETTPKAWLCTDWKSNPQQNGIWTISATFEQVPA